MQGRALVFINFVQAARCGHVAWGFLRDSPITAGQHDQYYYGSTDHLLKDPWWDLIGWLKYAHVEPTVNNDWWAELGDRSAMIRMMHKGHHIRYHAAKLISVPNADPFLAGTKASKLQHDGWSLLVNNCVHQTYEVLTAYGAKLPAPNVPVSNLIPKRWFAEIEGEYIDLAKEFAAI